jgi:hypothetical protein
MDLDLEQLIDVIESDDTTDPLDRVAAAATLKDQMEALGDELLDHFVKAARDQGCSWNQIGEALGVTRQAAQQRHGVGLLGRLVEGLQAGRFQRFTPRARAAVIAAQTVARERGHGVVGTEHVLLALLIERDSRTASVLTLLGCPPDLLRTTVLEQRAAPKVAKPPPAGLAPALAERARDVAQARGASTPDAGDLMLALADRSAMLTRALTELGVTPQALRDAIQRARGG